MITLRVANKNINIEISLADFVRQVFITCGKNVIEEIVPAAMPNISIASMRLVLIFYYTNFYELHELNTIFANSCNS